MGLGSCVECGSALPPAEREACGDVWAAAPVQALDCIPSFGATTPAP